jgi:hypothetical protein
MLAVERCCRRVMMVTTMPSDVADGTTESVLVIACQCATANSQGAIIDRPGATSAHQGAAVDHLNAVVGHQGVTGAHQGVPADHSRATVDR